MGTLARCHLCEHMLDHAPRLSPPARRSQIWSDANCSEATELRANFLSTGFSITLALT